MKSFPFFKQFDQMDCGPTCLQMISAYYGKRYLLQELRTKTEVSREGASILAISKTAESIGFRTLSVKIPYSILKSSMKFPTIVHWNGYHFIVVYKIKRSKVYVADPAIGLLTYSEDEFVNRWALGGDNLEGVALLLEPKPEFYENSIEQDENFKTGFTYLWGYFKTFRNFFLMLVISLLIGSLIQLTLPFLAQSIVDVGIRSYKMDFIYLVLIAQLMLVFSRATVDFIRGWILLQISTRINMSIISDFLLKLFKLPVSFFEGKMIGDILRRIDDHSRIEHFMSTSTLSTLFSFFNLIVFGVVLILYNINVFLIFILFSVLYVLYVTLFMKKRRDLDYKRFQQNSDTETNLIQAIQGISEIKMNNSEQFKRWEWERIQAKLFYINLKSTKLQQFQDAGGVLLNEIKNVIITIVVAIAVIKGTMTLGMMLAVQFIIGQLSSPVNDFVAFLRDWQDAKISLDRIGEIHSLKEEDSENISTYLEQDLAIKIKEGNKSIKIQNLSFRYEGSTSNALKNITLDIPLGKTTAVVGASGCGKTTLMKVMLKFYKPTEGEIFIDNVLLSSSKDHLPKVGSAFWRYYCGTVMQDGYIFSDSIIRNITLSDEDVNHVKLNHSLEIANIKDLIDSLPAGVNSKMGVDGIGLSQGQKQRLLIARAVYKDPQIIFFDEATSALDANNEVVIMERLNRFFANKTVVLIAHRLSTVRNADKIVVMQMGEIAEIGNHESLIAQEGIYFKLVKNQIDFQLANNL